MRRCLLALLLASTLPARAAAPAREAPPAPQAEESEAELPEPPVNLEDPFVAKLEAYRADALAKARSPEATLPLLRAMSLRDRLPNLVGLARLYGQFAESTAATPEVRGLARFLLAQVDRARGRMPRAAEHLQRLGFVRAMHVVGPFDNEGKRGCDVAYGPETSTELSAAFPGKARDVSWRRLPETNADGYVDLAALLRPTTEVLAYGQTVLDAANERRVVVHLGASGASRLFLNGQKVFADDAYHPPRFDQAHVVVTLRKGPNRLLYKVCNESGPFGFYLRLTGLDGEPLKDVTATAPDTLPAIAAKGAPPRPEVLPTAVDVLRTRADQQKSDARARGDYAEMLLYKRTFDTKDKRDQVEATRAARMAPQDESLQLLAARTESDDHNVQRQFLEAALAAAPKDPEAVLALADHLLSRGFGRRAYDTLGKLPEERPRYYPLAVLLARVEDDLGMDERSRRRYDALLARFPDRFELVREGARQARRREQLGLAAARFRVALSLRFDDGESRRALAGLLADLGDVEGALKELRELTALEPLDAYLFVRLAELAAANGKADEAKKAFARALEILPDEAELYERQARTLARLKDRDGATAALVKALALKPQDVTAKEALKALRGEQKGFGEDLAYDAAKLVAESKPVAGEDAVVLADLEAVKVFPSGLASRFHQTVERVQTARGVEAERSQWINYSPDRQELKIVRAKVLKPDGSVIESYNSSERSLSDTASRLYYDARARIVSFPNLAPGDVLELSYRLDDTANDNLLSDYFGDLQGIVSSLPKAHFDYYLSMPAGRAIYTNKVNLPSLAHDERPVEGGTLHHWHAENVAKIVAEPGMPGFAEVAPTLHVSTYKDWDAVGRFYWGLVRDQLVPTDEIRAQAKAIAARANTKDERALVSAVYDFVVTNTRYVGLEFGIHGYKPYPVEKILARRFGDCKDKASLIHALLESLGIESRMVLLRMRRLGRLDTNPASLSAFNHAIAYVPKFDLWLDGTAEKYGSRELPTEDRGALVLVVDPAGNSRIGYIPDGKAEDNLTRSTYDVAIAADGTAKITGKTVVSGVAAPDYRNAYEQEASRKQTFEQAWSRSFPGLSAKELKLSDLTDLEKDVEVGYALEVPRFAQPDGDALAFSPFGQGRSYVETTAPLSSRKQDLVLGYPWTNAFTYRVALPAGAPAELPEAVNVTTPFGALALEYKREGDAIVATGSIKLAVTRVSPADYPAFRAFMSTIDQALARKVRIPGAAKTTSR